MSTGIKDSREPLRVAVLGCGSVGSQVVRLLQAQSGDLTARVGAPVELVGPARSAPMLVGDGASRDERDGRNSL